MKISYSILTHNETDSLQKLLSFLIEHKDEEDEIVILDDYSDNETTKSILDTMTSIHEIKFEQRRLLKDFAGQKNHLKNMCTGDYIFNLDADELPHKWLMKNIKEILQANVNEKGWVNFPDYQGRIWKNRTSIRWEKPVHETLVGYKEYTYLPMEEQFAFYHPKDIDRQEKQNEFYGGI